MKATTFRFLSIASVFGNQALLKTPKWIIPVSFTILFVSSLGAEGIIWALGKASIMVGEMELSSNYVLIYMLSVAAAYVLLACVVASGASLFAIPTKAMYLGVKQAWRKLHAVSLSSSSRTIKALSQQAQTEHHDLHLAKTNKTFQKALPVSIPEDFEHYFTVAFTKKDANTGISGYELFLRALSSSEWLLTDLGRIAKLLYDARVVNPKYTSSFKAWIKEFFSAIGREDCPTHPEPGKYKLIENSSVGKCFYDLVNRRDKAMR